MYFLIAYLCITLPIAGWIVMSRETMAWRLGVTLGYLLISVLFLMAAPVVGQRIAKIMDEAFSLPVDNSIPDACHGSLDEAVAGLRKIQITGNDLVAAGVGGPLVLRGWIGSDRSLNHPLSVFLLQRDGSKVPVDFKVTQQQRPDVVTYLANPKVLNGGFSAEAVLPKDLPLGKYRILVECRIGNQADQYEPHCRVNVVSSAEGTALDAPIAKQMEERRRLQELNRPADGKAVSSSTPRDTRTQPQKKQVKPPAKSPSDR